MGDIVRLLKASFGKVALLNVDNSLVTHAHDAAHIVIWCSGAPGEMTVGGQPVELGPEVAATINPYEPHSHQFTGSGGGQFLAFYLDAGSLLGGAFRDHAFRFSECRTRLSAAERAAARSIHAFLADGIGQEHVVAYEIERFVLGMLIRTGSLLREGSAAPVPDFRVRKALRLMRQDLALRTGFDEMAREVGLSRPHFFALFKEHMKVTPNIYRNYVRTEEALRQLESTDETMINVALNLGFSSPGNFSRFFREHTGVPPRAYRNAARFGT